MSECVTSFNSLSTAPMYQLQPQLILLLLLRLPLDHASTTESAKTPPTPESTPHASTAESAKTPPTLESTPHTSTMVSAKTSPTLDSVVPNKAPMMTTPHTSGEGLAKSSPTLNSRVLTKTPVTTPNSTPSPAQTSSGELIVQKSIKNHADAPAPHCIHIYWKYH